MLMMMWVISSRTQMMTRKIMRHKVTYTIKGHGQGGASECLDVLRASTIELSARAIRNTASFPVYRDVSPNIVICYSIRYSLLRPALASPSAPPCIAAKPAM